MTQGTIHSETICDRQGQPLRAESATLLKALDKLLTVGAYYSAEHSQYLQAARKARDEIVGVIGGSRRHLAIEITAQGLLVGGQSLDPNHRNVRLLHDLLVPLNIARLEIDGTLSPEDLRQSLAALQRHKSMLGQTNTFQEIVIEDLPASVRAVSCSVLRRAEAEREGGNTGSESLTLDELLGTDDEETTRDGADSVRLTERFLELITQIIANLEAIAEEAGIPAEAGSPGSYVTVADLVALKRTLEHLVEVNPDPAAVAELIVQAERALGLSRDKKSVELVFQILKKDMAASKKPPRPKPPAGAGEADYRFTVAELLTHVEALAASTVAVPEPWAGSRDNHLGIALELLRSDPPRSLRNSLLNTVERLAARPDFGEQHLTLYARAAATVVTNDEIDAVDDLLGQLTGVLRQKAPRLVAPFWTNLLEATTTDHLPTLWPHLVNDILLGLNGAPRELTVSLVAAAGRLPLIAAHDESRRLKRQPALQGHTAAKDLFLAPLATSFPILVCLQTSPLQKWLGEEIYLSLRRKPASRLVELVIAALGEHDPLQTELYLELIQHGQDEHPPASLREPATFLLMGRLESLAPGLRRQEWVPHALRELSRLAPEESRPLLARVCRERRFFFFRAWPPAAREAAMTLAANADTEVR